MNLLIVNPLSGFHCSFKQICKKLRIFTLIVKEHSQIRRLYLKEQYLEIQPLPYLKGKSTYLFLRLALLLGIKLFIFSHFAITTVIIQLLLISK
jgi:hypothetical protein